MAERLSLYMTPICPFCHRVMRVIDQLGMEVEMRDTLSHAHHRKALVEARGRATVPVLLIERADGTAEWMPESADIITYLKG